MTKLIFKCPYLKLGAGAGRGRYAVYIATREGVEMVAVRAKASAEKLAQPATAKQRALIENILVDFPDAARTYEYEDYLAAQTIGNASEFISRALEENYSDAIGREGYVSYISERPGAERIGRHGLFGPGDTPIVLSQVAEEISNHPGNVWTPILSLRREDAVRLGFDNAARWQSLLRAHTIDFARHLKIPPEDFVWYAAFHNEGHHPHVHMLCYSRSAAHGFLTKEGIRSIRSELTKDIFQNELLEIYQRQTQHRDEAGKLAHDAFWEMCASIAGGACENERVTQLMGELVERLKHHSGKKVYGYLRPPAKAIVDAVVDELAKDPRAADAYKGWCAARREVLLGYVDSAMPDIPLSQNKEFKAVRNMVVKEAVNLLEGKLMLAPASLHTHSHADRSAWNVESIQADAEAGDADAQYDLAVLHIFGEVESRDEAAALYWLTWSAEQGNGQAVHLLARQNEWSRGAVVLAGTRLLTGLGYILAAKLPNAPAGGLRMAMDRKRRKELQQKKAGKGIHQSDQDQGMAPM